MSEGVTMNDGGVVASDSVAGNEGVTAAKGFLAAGVAAGLKESGALDVAALVNDGPLQSAAGVFTPNRFAAAPVLWTRQCLADGQLHAVAINSGGANACTGPQGFQNTHATAEFVAEALGCGAGEVGVCSTGLIGEQLPMDLLLAGLDRAILGLEADGGQDAATAIMTTDSHSKTAVAAAGGVTVGGMAKGAGMLAPGMATMLAFITTDAVAEADQLGRVLRRVNAQTFNRVDSDGCMSTNDTVLLLASGASGVALADEDLLALVHGVSAALSAQLVADAEGASKEIAVRVRHAASEDDAENVARAVARSNLFKTAMFGQDPNWGRILSAVGTTAATFDPTEVDVAVNGIWVCRGGGVGADRELVNLAPREVEVIIDLSAGRSSATVWTNDLTTEYVHENSAYST